MPDRETMAALEARDQFALAERLLFPSLCEPTAALSLPEPDSVVGGDRGVMVPRPRRTRAQDRAYRIDAERRLNDAYVAERNMPPPVYGW